MKKSKTNLNDVYILENEVFKDQRGWFKEVYSRKKFLEFGMTSEFIQENHSMSNKNGTLRGLHYQANPKPQTKLVRCSKGKILDIAVDLRKGSSTYKKWIGVELSEDNHLQLLIPKGFAHGFLALSDNVEVQYKVDEYYFPELDRSIRFDDKEIGIEWGIDKPILSEKDFNAPLLRDSDVDFSIRVLVTGANGQLGHDLVKIFTQMGIEVIGTDIEDFDITNLDEVKSFMLKCSPDLIIHCAAYTAVDKAESEKEFCFSVNVVGTKNIIEAVKHNNTKIVLISTDYVFDGSGGEPHIEAEKTKPINYYGQTKDLAERAILDNLEKFFIVRTSWLYGKNGTNFVKTILKVSEVKDEIRVVDDQIGSPTYSVDLAKFVYDLIQTDRYGIYHGVNEGYCSWYDFAKAIFEVNKKNVKVIPIASTDFSCKAKRPLNSKLSTINTDKAGIKKMPHWHDALQRFIKELYNQDEMK